MKLVNRSRSGASGLIVCLLLAGCDGQQTTTISISAQDVGSKKEVASLHEKLAATEVRKKQLAEEMSSASAIEAWVLAARPLTPLLKEIPDALGAETRITEIKVVRQGDEPDRILADVKASEAPKQALEAISSAMRQMGFRDQLKTVEHRDGEFSYHATLVWTDAPSRPQPPSVSTSSSLCDEPAEDALTPGVASGPGATSAEVKKLRSQLSAEQAAVQAMESEARDLLELSAQWLPYFAMVSENANVEMGISMKVRESDLVVPFMSFEVGGDQHAEERWVGNIRSLLRAKIVIEDEWDKTVTWLENMERIKPTMRIFSVSAAPVSGRKVWKFDVVLEVPLLEKNSN